MSVSEGRESPSAPGALEEEEGSSSSSGSSLSLPVTSSVTSAVLSAVTSGGASGGVKDVKGPAPPPPGHKSQDTPAGKKHGDAARGDGSRVKVDKLKVAAGGRGSSGASSQANNRKRKDGEGGAIAKSGSAPNAGHAARGPSRNHGHQRHGDASNRARRNASRERTRHRDEPPDHQVSVTLPNLSVTSQEPPTPESASESASPAPTNQNPGFKLPTNQNSGTTPPTNQINPAVLNAPVTNQNQATTPVPTNQNTGRGLRVSPALDTTSSGSGSASESPPARPRQNQLAHNQSQTAPRESQPQTALQASQLPVSKTGKTDTTKTKNSPDKFPWEGAASLATIGPPDPIPHNWQGTKGTVKERLTFMFNNEVLADVHFLVGRPPRRIPAHRFMLSVGSAVFDAMFNGGIAEEAEVELPDVEPAAFLALLRFLYSDEVHIGPETVMTTLYTAKKYAVPALERACVDFLKRNLSPDNAFMLLTQARLFDEPQLAALCLETIDRNTGEALAAEGFTDIDQETLRVFLERDTLGIRECKLFSALCRWGEAERARQSLPDTPASRRAVLSPVLPLLRFPLMTVEEFAVGPAQSGILSDREVVQLFLYFTVTPRPVVGFSDTPRCCLTGKEQCVARFCQIESRWGYSGTSDRIRFMVNRRIFVVGFGLYGSIHGPADYTVNIQIIHTDTGKLCGVNDTSFTCDGTSSTCRVMFKEPVEITANVSYTACATLKGPDSYYGTKGLRKVTHESLASGKVTFQFTYAAGNNNGTSVEDGQIPEIIFYT